MERNIIEYFKNRMTRTTNIVGHLSKREDMRVWFYERYPNPSDWTNFFHDHQKHFIYDQTNGNIRVKTNSTEPQIEVKTSK
jgi:hypothetical protein